MDIHQLINEHFPSEVKEHHIAPDHLLLKTGNNVLLKIEAITDHVFRFRFSAKGYFEKDFSYALDEDYRTGFTSLRITEEEDHFEMASPKIRAIINKENLRIKIYDEHDNLINEDEKGFHWEVNTIQGGNIVKMSKKAMTGEHYFGLGDKPTNLNLRDKRLQNWGTDEYGFQKNTDPLYRNIPFYYGLHERGCYGIFFDNTFRSFFDFASERKNVTSFWADGGEINYYYIAGSNLMNIARRYARITGLPELPPLWTLGYHQCKWSYDSEETVRKITSKMRELEIPCDAIYLDIDYMDGFRCFTWNDETFPNPKQMVDDLKAQGYKTVAIIDPGIKVDMDYDVCKEGFDKGYFCTYADGPLYTGKVWPGDCYFPDFTNPKVRKWWSKLFKGLIEEVGLRGIWNDMNEPAIMEVPTKTFPLEVRHDFDGHPCSHRKAHNVYGMQMSRATYEGVKQFAHPNRPFIITRSTFSGGQRYSSVWTGDNIASWEHLWVANVQCQRLSISGFSFVGSDIGGFTEHPSMELYVRWLQLAVFHPLMRTHSSGDHGAQEPWSFGEEGTELARKAIEMRYRLLPYHYTTFYQYTTDGTPMIRPMAFYESDNPESWYRQDEFIFGDHILVCPILEPNREGRRMYIPKGDWYSYHTSEMVEGGKEMYVETPMDRIPVFVKAGTILPHYPVQQFVGEKEFNEVELHIYKGGEPEKSLFYEDAGDGYGYLQGYYAKRTFNTQPNGQRYRITQHKSGEFEPAYAHYKLIFHGFERLPREIEVDGSNIQWDAQGRDGTGFTALVSKNFHQLTLRW